MKHNLLEPEDYPDISKHLSLDFSFSFPGGGWSNVSNKLIHFLLAERSKMLIWSKYQEVFYLPLFNILY